MTRSYLSLMKVHAICTNFWIFSLSPVEKTNINQPILCFVDNLTFNQMPQRVFTFQDLGKLEQYSIGVFDLKVKLDGLQQDPLHGHHFLLPTNRPVVSVCSKQCREAFQNMTEKIKGYCIDYRSKFIVCRPTQHQ